MKAKISSVFLIIFLQSCIDPYAIPTDETPYILTVDGLISTQPGIHKVRLTWANTYTNISDGNRIPIKGSEVYVIDDLGNMTEFEEEEYDFKWVCIGLFGWRPRVNNRNLGTIITTGHYISPQDFHAVVGRTYTLFVSTPEGGKYKSKPVKVLGGTKIDSLYILPYSVGTTNPLISSKGLNLMVTFKDYPDESNYYLWKGSNSYFELNTDPDKGRIPVTCDNNACYIPDLDQVKFLGTKSDVIMVWMHFKKHFLYQMTG